MKPEKILLNPVGVSFDDILFQVEDGFWNDDPENNGIDPEADVTVFDPLAELIMREEEGVPPFDEIIDVAWARHNPRRVQPVEIEQWCKERYPRYCDEGYDDEGYDPCIEGSDSDYDGVEESLSVLPNRVRRSQLANRRVNRVRVHIRTVLRPTGNPEKDGFFLNSFGECVSRRSIDACYCDSHGWRGRYSRIPEIRRHIRRMREVSRWAMVGA